jgi:membrane fusion protein
MIRNKQNSRDSLEQGASILVQEPPRGFIRGLAWLILSIFSVAIAAACLVKLPETVRCPCVLAPENGMDPIQSPRMGTIAAIRIKAGQEVQANEELFVLRSDEIRNASTLLKTTIEDLNALEWRRKNRAESHSTLLGIKKAEIEQVERELEFREKHAATVRDWMTRIDALSKEGLVSEISLMEHQLRLAEAEKDFSVTQKTLQQARLEEQRLETEYQRERSDDSAEVEKLNVRLSSLKQQLENSDSDRLSIRAPCRAQVLSLVQQSPGSVVQSGQELCQLVRLEGKPRAWLDVPEAFVPRLATNQAVRFFMDAFPYQRYGTVSGRLIWVSPASVGTGDGSRFVAKAELEQATFLAHGESRPLRAGMKGEARILVGSRTMVEMIFEPARRLREEMRR